MSKLLEKINSDFTAAFKARETEKKNFLGVLKGEVTREKKEPADAEVIAKIESMIKNNNKSIEKSGVSSLSDVELGILESYLPKQMTEEEIDIKLKEAIDGGANNIGAVMAAFKGLPADMKLVNQKVKQTLNL
ncbi:MAG: GatB/YqeY domain-containing protein [Nanoarchaeota archaeon]